MRIVIALSALIASAALAADPVNSARGVLTRCFGPRAAEIRLTLPEVSVAEGGGTQGIPAGCPETPGVDLMIGMVHVRGQWRRLVRMLRQFEHSYGDAYADVLRQTREQGDWESSVRLAHTLKGTARLIGASELGAQAETLESALRAGSAARAAALEHLLDAELRRVVAGVAKVLEWVGPETPASRLSEGEARRQGELSVRDLGRIAEYRTLLTNNETVAARQLQEVVKVLNAAGGAPERIAALVDAVEGFDFQTASGILEELAGGLVSVKE